MVSPDPIELVKERLKKYPHIQYEAGKSYVGVRPGSTAGFDVMFTADSKQFIVAALGWHEIFKDFDEAWNCFVFLLSNEARLRVHYRGDFARKFVLQYRKDDQWVDESEMGLFFYPFWVQERVEYLQNDLIKS